MATEESTSLFDFDIVHHDWKREVPLYQLLSLFAIQLQITDNFLITLTTKLTLLREKLKADWFIPGGPKTHDCAVSIPRFIPK